MRSDRLTTLALLLIWLAALPPLWLSLARAPALRVDVGAWGDHALLEGVNGPEQSSTEDYRWTTGRAELVFPSLSPAYRLLTLRAHGWRPEGPSPRVRLELGDRTWATLQTSVPLRVYRVLLPADASAAQTRLRLVSETYQPPGDPRVIGFAIDWAELRRAGQALPAPWQAGGQALLLALLLACLRGRTQNREQTPAATWPPDPLTVARVVCGAGLAGGLVALNLADPLWVGLVLGPWLVLAAGMLAGLWVGGPGLARWLRPWMSEREARLAVGMLAGALALRLAGAIHPFFDSHDLPVHDRWMRIVAAGQLYLYSTPGELQNRLIFNPPAGYLLLLPGWLLVGELRLVIQAGTALVDGLGCLLLLVLARELGLSGRAALVALALYAALPINMTMLWWGFATNDIAQTLWLLLLWLLLRLARRPTWRNALLVGAGTAACALTHVGALVLVAAMLGLLALAGLLVLPRRTWLLLAGALAAAGLVTALVYLSAAAAPVLAQPADPRARTLPETLARSLSMRDVRLMLVGRAFEIGFTLPLLALIPGGLLAMLGARRAPALLGPLVATWLLVSAAFFTVYMSLGLLTRYIYFGAPLLCLAGGAGLARLWWRPAGRVFVAALVALVLLGGAALWFGGVLLRDKPSLVPLTH